MADEGSEGLKDVDYADGSPEESVDDYRNEAEGGGNYVDGGEHEISDYGS